MGDNCQRGNDAEFCALQEGCSNQDAINEIMKSIANQDQQTGTAMIMSWCLSIMCFAVIMMTMTPKNQLFEYKKRKDAE